MTKYCNLNITLEISCCDWNNYKKAREIYREIQEKIENEV